MADLKIGGDEGVLLHLSRIEGLEAVPSTQAPSTTGWWEGGVSVGGQAEVVPRLPRGAAHRDLPVTVVVGSARKAAVSCRVVKSLGRTDDA